MRRQGQIASAALGLLAWTSVAAAAGGYGPFTPPALPGGPSAFESKVLVAKTFGRVGGRLSATLANSDRLTVVVAPGTFTRSEQIAITGPSLSELASTLKHLHRGGSRAETGFALVIASAGGRPLTSRLAKPLAVTVRGSNLGAEGESVLSVTSTTASKLVSKRTRAKIAFSLAREADCIVVDPTGT